MNTFEEPEILITLLTDTDILTASIPDEDSQWSPYH